MAFDSDFDAHAPWPHQQIPKNYLSSPSTSSTTSSSSSSTYSIDAPSSQSSISPSIGSSTSVWCNEDGNPDLSARSLRQQKEQVSSKEENFITSYASHFTSQECPPAEVVAPKARQHPRRTQRLNSSEFQNGQSTAHCPRPPPSLVRQSERKDNFVDSLVDTTTQMIETIWPLSVLSCGRDTVLGNKQQNLIGLRTFVQEVLRRSKTSYSTLQVALYYLILIQSCIPNHDFTMEQSEDSSACRAMQCGRRMFLAALILASKYLQDRNFSARAWSKISGLRTCEINANELAFLSAVNWKLHIPEPVFHRWTDIVLRYSPSSQVNAPPRSSPRSSHTWKSIIPYLTPDLDTCEFGAAEMSDDSGYNSPGSDMSPPPLPIYEEMPVHCELSKLTPTNPSNMPRMLEPQTCDVKKDQYTLPPLPRLSHLPTPQLTPKTGTFCTPAVSASGRCPKRPSMAYAMGQIRETCLAKSTLDNTGDWQPTIPESCPVSVRRSSLARSSSSMSSPESMISDLSSRSSRSSSISSVASSNCALSQARLAVQATRRCANMQLCGVKEESQPPAFEALDGDELGPSCEGLSAPAAGKSYFDKDIKQSASNVCNVNAQHNASTREAAVALRELALNRQHIPPPESLNPRRSKGLKRPRPNSIDLSVQSRVRDLIAPRCLGDVTNSEARNQDDGIVLPDENHADSFLLRQESARSATLKNSTPNETPKLPFSRDGLPRKRTCAGSDRGGREESRMIERLISQREGMGPGIWEGII